MTRLLWAVFAVLCLAFVAVSAKAVQSYSIAGVQPDPMLAVVKIITDKGHGSGFHMGNGHIITAAHVLRGVGDCIFDKPGSKRIGRFGCLLSMTANHFTVRPVDKGEFHEPR